MFSTLTKMVSPCLDDFISMLLNDTLYFMQFFRIQLVVDGQRHNGFQPEFCFSAFTCYVDMDAICPRNTRLRGYQVTR